MLFYGFYWPIFLIGIYLMVEFGDEPCKLYMVVVLGSVIMSLIGFFSYIASGYNENNESHTQVDNGLYDYTDLEYNKYTN